MSLRDSFLDLHLLRFLKNMKSSCERHTHRLKWGSIEHERNEWHSKANSYKPILEIQWRAKFLNFLGKFFNPRILFGEKQWLSSIWGSIVGVSLRHKKFKVSIGEQSEVIFVCTWHATALASFAFSLNQLTWGVEKGRIVKHQHNFGGHKSSIKSLRSGSYYVRKIVWMEIQSYILIALSAYIKAEKCVCDHFIHL